MPELVLYGYWRSSSSHRVRIALGLKGLEYRHVAVNLLKDEQSSPAHKARSPAGYVPCLAVDGVEYIESVAILELLDELFPASPLYPQGPHARARVRSLVEIINSGTQPLQNRHVMLHVSSDPDVQKAFVRRYVVRGLAAFEGAMANHEREGVSGPFAYGASPSAADVLLVPQVFSARRFGIELDDCPRVLRAFDAAMALEAFQRAAPERQPDAVPS